MYKQEEKISKTGKKLSLYICAPVPTCGQLLDRFLSTNKKCCFRRLGPSLFLSSRNMQVPKMMHLCWLVPAGSWKATTHITLHYPSGLRISFQVHQSHREEINWKQCTSGDVVSQLPEYSSVMFITCCADVFII